MSSSSSSSISFSESAVRDAVAAVLQRNFDAASKVCLVTVLKLLDNVLQKPHEARFRVVKLSNAAVQTKIGSCRGGVEVLMACGFAYYDNNDSSNNNGGANGNKNNTLVLPDHSLPQQEFLARARHLVVERCVRELGCRPEELPRYQPPPPAVQLVLNNNNNNTTTSAAAAFDPYRGQRFDGLSAAVGARLGPDDDDGQPWKSRTEAELERLQRQQRQLEAKLHHRADGTARDWTAARPGEALPAAPSSNAAASASSQQQQQQQPSDGALLAQRAQRLQAERLQREQGGFTTAAMRQVERLKKQKVYSHCALQVQFPNGSRCCGQFLPSETVGAVRAALRSDCLNETAAGVDFDLYVAPPRRLLPPASKLQSEGLVPAAKLFVSWRVAPAPTDCLKPELFQQRQNAAAVAFPKAHAVAAATTATAQSNKTDDGDSEPAQKKKTGNREEDLLKRMMGGGGGLGGGGSKKSSKKASGNNSNKPKWFKG